MGELHGSAWLGLVGDGDGWRLPVGDGVISGASALFGGCATAAAVVIAGHVTDHPVVWATAHFGALAKHGSEVTLTARTISSGRTMTHLEITGCVDERESFSVRVAAGSRPAHDAAGQYVSAPPAGRPEDGDPFDHPVHEGTWASRFEWRLAGSGIHEGDPSSTWWVRPTEAIEPLVAAAVLCDYVTYGVGRALGTPMGGLSIDNALRVHRAASPADGWYLLDVRPEAVEGGFGHGTARLYADGALVASGSQSMIVNTWDWRLPAEREAVSP